MAAPKKPQSKSTELAVKAKDPKPYAVQLDKRKKDFIAALKELGTVKYALEKSGLALKTAYEHLKTDSEFASEWMQALDLYNDSLLTEIDKRAVQGVQEPVFHNGKKVATVTKKSDTLLMFLVNRHDRHDQKKWQKRIIQTAQLALSVVVTRGTEIGLSNEQIEELQLKMTEEFRAVLMA